MSGNLNVTTTAFDTEIQSRLDAVTSATPTKDLIKLYRASELYDAADYTIFTAEVQSRLDAVDGTTDGTELLKLAASFGKIDNTNQEYLQSALSVLADIPTNDELATALSPLSTKVDLNPLATKTDLDSLATKVALNALATAINEIPRSPIKSIQRGTTTSSYVTISEVDPAKTVVNLTCSVAGGQSSGNYERIDADVISVTLQNSTRLAIDRTVQLNRHYDPNQGDYIYSHLGVSVSYEVIEYA